MRRPSFALLVALVLSLTGGGIAAAQDEGYLHAEFRKEGDRIKEDCASIKKILGCTMTFVTDHPVHVALGSIAPGNGFGIGGSFGLISNRNIDWPLSFSADAVAAPGGAWRAGAYLKFRHTGRPLPAPVGAGGGTAASSAIRPYPIYSIYVQGISLPSVLFYGLGPDSAKDDRTAFSMRQTIVGGNAIVPVSPGWLGPLNLALLGEVNGRFTDNGATGGDKAPSIESRFTPIDAPGLSDARRFVQFGEGVRVKPSLWRGRLRFNYLGQFQQFVTGSDAGESFRRWTADLGHEVSIYRQSAAPVPPEAYNPNECPAGSDGRCPRVAPVRINGAWNKTGTIGFRLLMSKSQVSGSNIVPFYFQQTIGGSDINGNKVLASYDDYRFRGPHVLLLQETFEHAIAGPVGIFLAADQGKVALQDESLDFTDLRRSFAVGATIRAGAAPMVVISWATGGPEGHHVAFTVNTSLLGGASRPSLH